MSKIAQKRNFLTYLGSIFFPKRAKGLFSSLHAITLVMPVFCLACLLSHLSFSVLSPLSCLLSHLFFCHACLLLHLTFVILDFCHACLCHASLLSHLSFVNFFSCHACLCHTPTYFTPES